VSATPDGITLSRSLELKGRSRGPWLRRLLLCCVAALPVLALLNVFGQHPSTTTASSPAATLSVTAPTRLRGGLIFQVKVKVQAHREIGQLQIALDTGWWESMSVNSIEPNPSSETSHNGQVVLAYGNLPAGQTLISWIYFQVNPTNVGERREDVAIQDGSKPLVRIHRSATIFP
jgi:Mn2+/Fe2+ NRAMP family transporter